MQLAAVAYAKEKRQKYAIWNAAHVYDMRPAHVQKWSSGSRQKKPVQK